VATKPLVVVADSVGGTRDLLRIVFEDAFGAYVLVVNGAAALLVASHETVPQLVVLEIGVHPELDRDIVRRLKEGPLAPVPLVCLTAWGVALDCAELVAVGCDACLAKPFELDELIARSRALLGRRRPRRRSPRRRPPS
jgi:DNA-binding response OmpR family regulator